MTQNQNPFNTVKLVRCRSSKVTIVVVLVAVVLSMVALLALNSAIGTAEASAEDLRFQAFQLEQENSRLEYYISELGTVQGIIRIAQEKLGLIDPNSVIIQPE